MGHYIILPTLEQMKDAHMLTQKKTAIAKVNDDNSLFKLFNFNDYLPVLVGVTTGATLYFSVRASLITPA